MRRKPGALVPIEEAILAAGVELGEGGEAEFHGFAIAKRIRERDEARRLTAHGTLYKALGRLERDGLLESRWEDPERAAKERRPRRRLHMVTGIGELALTRAEAARAQAPPRVRPEGGLAPS